jgi:hypothetical protein
LTRALAAAVLVSLASVTNARAVDAKKPYVVGNWYGEGQPGDRDAYWVSHEWPDGRIEIRFRGCLAGKTRWESTLAGTWSIKGNIEELSITSVNGRKKAYMDRYEMLSYDGRKRTYRHVERGTLFSSIRVSDKFQLPSCARTS